MGWNGGFLFLNGTAKVGQACPASHTIKPYPGSPIPDENKTAIPFVAKTKPPSMGCLKHVQDDAGSRRWVAGSLPQQAEHFFLGGFSSAGEDCELLPLPIS
ncbi:MAG TPA: hypothetical protein VF472_12035 [Burkholderiaceae bacterium]